MLLNCQALTTDKIDEINIELDNCLSVRFLCLVETWANHSSISKYRFSGFSLASSYCRSSCRGGGVAIWIRDCLSFKSFNFDTYCVDKDFEICGITTVVDAQKILVLTGYRSPSSNLQFFLEGIHQVMENVYVPNSKIVICGDFNCDSYRLSSNYKELLSVLQGFGLDNIVKWPTRVTNTSVTTLDQIFTNDSQGNMTSCVLDNTVSDHRTVYADLIHVSNNANSNFTTMSRSFNSTSIENFKFALQHENWSSLYAFRDIDSAFSYFFDVFYYHFGVNFPLIRKYINTRTKKWINDEVKSSSASLKDLFVLSKIYPELRQLYKQAKREHRRLVGSTKRAFYQQKIDRAANPSRCAWTIINELANRNKKHKNISLMVNNSSDCIENPSAVAEIFNSFFRDAPLNTISQIVDHNNVKTINNGMNINRDASILCPFTDDEFITVLNKKLKNKPSAGPDDVPSFLLKKILDVITKPLVFLINLSFCTGKFPTALKTGKIIPIHKKGNVSCMENYRPITLTSVFSKMFEYCFLERLVLYLNKFNIISPNQHGFQCGRSTDTAIHAFYNELIRFIDANEAPVGIFCDLSRAFDCVNHEILFKKITKYGISGTSFDWIQSFVTHRRQYVSVNHFDGRSGRVMNSSSLDVSVGVPQGSVLGPVLFLLYLNDVDDVGCDEHRTAYADDVSFLISNKFSDILEETSNNVLSELSAWFGRNSMFLNVDKTQFVRFHSRQKQSESINLCIGDKPLTETNAVKFLGIHLDQCLNWRVQCEHVMTKLNSSYYLFINLRPVMGNEQLVMLYHAHVESHLRYGLVFWGMSTLSGSVFIKQKKILRCIARVPRRHSCKMLFKKYNILPLPCLYILEIASFIYCNRSDFAQNKDIHGFNTRYKNNFCVPNSRGRIAYTSPGRFGIKIFNRLPEEIKNSNTIFNFKNNLKTFLMTKCFYSIDEFLNYMS